MIISKINVCSPISNQFEGLRIDNGVSDSSLEDEFLFSEMLADFSCASAGPRFVITSIKRRGRNHGQKAADLKPHASLHGFYPLHHILVSYTYVRKCS